MKNPLKEMHPWIIGILSLLVLLFVVSTFFFIQESLRFHRDGMHPRNPLKMFASGAQQGITQEIDTIETWMTFSYLNFAFHLPDDFFRDKLAIDHPKYPKVSIESYARNKNLDKNILLDEIKTLLRQPPSLPEKTN